jgi:hypothetical protein
MGGQTAESAAQPDAECRYGLALQNQEAMARDSSCGNKRLQQQHHCRFDFGLNFGASCRLAHMSESYDVDDVDDRRSHTAVGAQWTHDQIVVGLFFDILLNSLPIEGHGG